MILSIDVGGTFIKYAWMDQEGNFIEKGKVETPSMSVDAFDKTIENIWNSKEQKSGITFSMPGTIDPDSGYIIQGGSLRYHDGVEFKAKYIQKLKTQVAIENDARCAALAELETGSMKNVKDGLVLTFGTGIGGGVIINHQIHRGYNLFSGEISLCTYGDIRKEGFDSYFGSKYSIVKFIENVKIKLNLEESMNGKDIFKLIEAKEPTAVCMFEEYCEAFAQQIFNFYLLLAPERICLGGGVSSNPIFIKGMQSAINNLHKAYIIPVPKPNVLACRYFNEANLIGAFYNLKKRKE